MPVKLARLLPDITIGCCFDSHPRIDSVLQNSGFRYGLLENAIEMRQYIKIDSVLKFSALSQPMLQSRSNQILRFSSCLSGILIAAALYLSSHTPVQAAPRSDISKVRGEYLRLRNIDPTGDSPVHRNSWEALASRIREIVVQRGIDDETAALRIMGAEAQLRLYRTRKEHAYLSTAKALVSPVVQEGAMPPKSVSLETRAEALLLSGDIALHSGRFDAAEQLYSQARSETVRFSNTAADKRVNERLQGIKNGTYMRFLPSSDREIPRVLTDREAQLRGAAGPIVVLDPGHGGSDVGATSEVGGVEKEITLDIARRVKAILERRYQVKVQLTREDDSFVPLARRTAFANRKDGAAFVSLHVNASEEHDADGLEAYYLDNTNDEASRKLAERENGVPPGEALDDLSFMLSDLIQSGKLEDSIVLTRSVESGIRSKVMPLHKGLRSLGVKKAPFFVLVGAHMPCSLIEMFFVDSPKEGRKLRDDSFRSALASGIADGIARFLKRT
ncbi:MAG: N-acetylmuramoyl-L-alanine amidase [Pseudomonadota bacterium]